MSGSNISDDMLETILLRLPFKSIVRCKCLSRGMCNFTKRRDDKDLKVLLTSDGSKLFSVSFPNPKVLMYDRPHTMSDYNVRVVGACMSIVCLCDGERLYLWNPTDGKVETIVVPGKPLEVESNSYGFAFHDTKLEFQIVRLWTPAESHGLSYLSVYSVSSKSWMKAQSLFYQVPEVGGKFVNGNLHWPADFEGSGWTDSVIAFNLGSRKCEAIPLPEGKTGPNVVVSEVGVVHHCLSIVLCEESAIEVWVMTDYGEMKSWSKFFCHSSYNQSAGHWGQVVPLFFINKGTELLFCDRSGLFVLCSKDVSEGLRRIEIAELAEGNLEGIVYTETKKEPAKSLKRKASSVKGSKELGRGTKKMKGDPSKEEQGMSK